MKDTAPKTILLKDYEAPAFLVETIDLTFTLHDTKTLVESVMKIHANGGKTNDLVLIGEELELVSVVLDGKELTKDQYKVEGFELTVFNVPQNFTLKVTNIINPEANKTLDGLYKSGTIGGVVSGSKDAMDYVKHTARSFMFSASMPPSAVATVSACLDVIENDDSILKNLWSNVEFMRKGFHDIGFYTYNSQTPIIPIFIGDDLKAMQVTKFLNESGVFATPVVAPAVPRGEALIRTSYMASHEKEDLQTVLEIFAKAKNLFDITDRKLH